MPRKTRTLVARKSKPNIAKQCIQRTFTELAVVVNASVPNRQLPVYIYLFIDSDNMEVGVFQPRERGYYGACFQELTNERKQT